MGLQIRTYSKKLFIGEYIVLVGLEQAGDGDYVITVWALNDPSEYNQPGTYVFATREAADKDVAWWHDTLTDQGYEYRKEEILLEV